MPDRAMRSPRKKYARGMGYPDLQDGRPPRSRAGAELADGLVPAEMDSEEAAEYRPPQVPGTDRRRVAAATGTTARPGYAGARGYDGPGDGVARAAARTTDRGHGRPAVTGPAAARGPAAGTRSVPAARARTRRPGPPGRTSPAPQRPARAARAAGRHRPGPASPGPAIRANSPWPSAPGTGPAAADASGRPADGRPPATEAAGRTGPPARRPAAGDRPWPPGPASTGPQPSYRARPDSSDDAPPGLAITREPPGARRRAAAPDGTPRSGGRGGPVRGYPPGPGQPDPVYPPGQFSPWNRAATRAAWLGTAPAGAASGPAEADAEPGYSALALSDAAADLTATQTWAVIDDEPPPSLPATPRASRDWGSHAEESGPARPRTAAGGGDPGRRTDSRTTDSRTTDSRTTDSRTTDSRTTGDWTTSPRRARGTGPPAPGFGERTATGERHADLSRPGAAELDATGPGAAAVAPAGAERTAQGPGTGGLGRPGRPGCSGHRCRGTPQDGQPDGRPAGRGRGQAGPVGLRRVQAWPAAPRGGNAPPGRRPPHGRPRPFRQARQTAQRRDGRPAARPGPRSGPGRRRIRVLQRQACPGRPACGRLAYGRGQSPGRGTEHAPRPPRWDRGSTSRAVAKTRCR